MSSKMKLIWNVECQHISLNTSKTDEISIQLTIF